MNDYQIPIFAISLIVPIIIGILAFFMKRTLLKLDNDIINHDKRLISLEKNIMASEAKMMPRSEVIEITARLHDDVNARFDQLREDQKDFRLEFIAGMQGCRMDNDELRKEMNSSLNKLLDKISAIGSAKKE